MDWPRRLPYQIRLFGSKQGPSPSNVKYPAHNCLFYLRRPQDRKGHWSLFSPLFQMVTQRGDVIFSHKHILIKLGTQCNRVWFMKPSGHAGPCPLTLGAVRGGSGLWMGWCQQLGVISSGG